MEDFQRSLTGRVGYVEKCIAHVLCAVLAYVVQELTKEGMGKITSTLRAVESC